MSFFSIYTLRRGRARYLLSVSDRAAAIFFAGVFQRTPSTPGVLRPSLVTTRLTASVHSAFSPNFCKKERPGWVLHSKWKHTIKLIRELTSEIDEIEVSIQKIMDELNPPILSIPGVGIQSAAMILAEIGDFSNFESPDKVLAYAGCSPSTYQSGKLTNCYAHMEKRGSRYLRYALYNATKYVCYWNPVFAEYLAKKRAEGKHYNVALSHATKKLVRLIYALQKSGKAYLTAA